MMTWPRYLKFAVLITLLCGMANGAPAKVTNPCGKDCQYGKCDDKTDPSNPICDCHKGYELDTESGTCKTAAVPWYIWVACAGCLFMVIVLTYVWDRIDKKAENKIHQKKQKKLRDDLWEDVEMSSMSSAIEKAETPRPTPVQTPRRPIAGQVKALRTPTPSVSRLEKSMAPIREERSSREVQSEENLEQKENVNIVRGPRQSPLMDAFKTVG
eukprot:126644_1